MARALPKLPTAVLAVVDADPGFPAVGDAAKSPTTSPELATCPHSRLRLAPLSFSFPGRHERRVSKLTVSSRFASSAPRISNPPQPKLDNLPSFLLDPSFASLIDQIAGNRSFSGCQPLKPVELHSAVELLPPVPVLFAQQLKLTLGEPLVLMVSTFLRVRKVSTLVSRHAAAGHRVHRRRTPAPRLRRPPATLARAPEPPGCAIARAAPPRRRLSHRRRSEPRRRLLCLAPPPLGFAEPAALPPRATRARAPPPSRCRAPPCGPPPVAADRSACAWAPPRATACVAGRGRSPSH